MLAELHCHSIYSTGNKILSEGSDYPEDIIKQAKKLGIGILAITDHDNMDAYPEAKKLAKKAGIILIPGEEVTTIDGHMLALGISETIKPKMSIEESVDEVHKQGGICIAAHPFDRRRYGMGEAARNCDVIEIFNALSLDRQPNFFSKDFAKELGKPVSAGSDAHNIKMMGLGRNYIEANSVDSALKALKSGKNRIEGEIVKTDIIADWMIERLRYSYFYTTSYIKNNYRQPKKFISLKLMSMVKRDYGNMKYLFRAAGYGVLGGVITYSVLKNSIVNTLEKLA